MALYFNAYFSPWWLVTHICTLALKVSEFSLKLLGNFGFSYLFSVQIARNHLSSHSSHDSYRSGRRRSGPALFGIRRESYGTGIRMKSFPKILNFQTFWFSDSSTFWLLDYDADPPVSAYGVPTSTSRHRDVAFGKSCRCCAIGFSHIRGMDRFLEFSRCVASNFVLSDYRRFHCGSSCC